MRIGFIGTGEIAACMVRALTGRGHEILVSERNAQVAAELTRLPDVSAATNADVVVQTDTVILCLMAQVAETVLPTLPFRPDHQVISVMADMPLTRVAPLCSPATDISLTIPLPFIDRGGCPLPVYPDTGSVAALFGGENIIVSCTSQDGFNAHMAACALSSVVLADIQHTADWLAGLTGDASGAEAYVAALIAGYFQGMRFDGAGEVQAALDSLSTEGGFNATLRDHMAPARDELTRGLDAFRPRLGLPDA